MATTYTPNAKLQQPAAADRGWDVPVNANAAALDATNAVGGLCVTTHEPTSSSLQVDVAAGGYARASGVRAAYAGGTAALPASQAAVYVYLTDAGVLTASAAGFPAGDCVPLAVAVTGASAVTSIADARVPLASCGADRSTVYLALAGGTFADAGSAVTVHTGTAHGTKFGGSAAELLGLWGAAPVPQPSGPNQAAVTDGSGGTASFAIAPIADGPTADAVATLARQVDALRTALVAAGAIKGGA